MRIKRYTFIRVIFSATQAMLNLYMLKTTSLTMRSALCACFLYSFAFLPSMYAVAAEGYRWVDSQGQVHYGDRSPSVKNAHVQRFDLSREPKPLARLRMERNDAGGYQAVVDNLIAGPIEVRLNANDPSYLNARPALPARATIAAHASIVIAELQNGKGNATLFLDSIPGSSNANPKDIEYGFPLKSNAVSISQSWNGSYSHDNPENMYAIDLETPINTPVLAARDGKVMQYDDGYTQTTLTPNDETSRANFIRILHDDGSMAVYGHIAANSVTVKQGDRVRRGQAIALSGNTGFSSGPHLHFAVQANRGMKLLSLPFKMFGPTGIMRFSLPVREEPASTTTIK